MSTTLGSAGESVSQQQQERYLRRRRESLSVHPTQVGLDWIDVTATSSGSNEFTFTLNLVPDDSGGSKHDLFDTLAPLMAAEPTEYFRFTAAGAPADGLFTVTAVDHPAGSDQLVLTVTYAGDEEKTRRLGGSPIFTLEMISIPELDPFFSCLSFSPSTLVPLATDCEEEEPPPTKLQPLAGDYLARDFASYRRLMLDHLARLLPEWSERNVADLWVTLVELLADAADQLSYFQDAVATESYLGTARRRISVRRHAKLVDYKIEEGTNGRTWAAFEVGIPAEVDGTAVRPGSGLIASDGLTVTGFGTAFTTELAAGDLIGVGGGGPDGASRAVAAVIDDTTLTLVTPFDPEIGAEGFAFAAAGGGVAGSGTISTDATSPLTVTGGGTSFTNEVMVGDVIEAAGQERVVTEVLSNSQLTVGEAFSPTLTADSYTIATPTAGGGRLVTVGTAVTGFDTSFTTEIAATDLLIAGSAVRSVASVTDDNTLTLAAAFASDVGGAGFAIATDGVRLGLGRGTIDSLSTAVTGTDTAFLAEVSVGDVLAAPGAAGSDDQLRVVTEVLDDFRLTIDAPFDPAPAGSTYQVSGVELLSREPGRPLRLTPGSTLAEQALMDALVFETMEPATLWHAHNELPIYGWEAPRFSLAAGATGATLAGTLPRLRPGMVLVIEEVKEPDTGDPAEADPETRHPVRLTAVRSAEDPLAADLPPAPPGSGTITSVGTAVTGTGTAFFTELRPGDFLTAPNPMTSAPERRQVAAIASDTDLTLWAAFSADLAVATAFTLDRLTQVEWAADDALPFNMCISTVLEDGTAVTGMALARGNLVLSDHGRRLNRNRRFVDGTVSSLDTTVTGVGTTFEADLRIGDLVTAAGQVRQVATIADDLEIETDEPFEPPLAAGSLLARGGLPEVLTAEAGRYRPKLEQPGLTHREPYDPAAAADLPAADLRSQDPDAALPVIDLRAPGVSWHLETDLLTSDRFADDFVVEMNDERRGVLRFGDGTLGRQPLAGTTLTPVYRIGNGTEGNLGRCSLAHLVSPPLPVNAVDNPLPAIGGVEPESLNHVRLTAPGLLKSRATRTAVDDVALLAESFPGVSRAAASLRWTGSWHTLLVAVQREGGEALDDAFEAELTAYLEDDRLAVWELEIVPLDYVGLDIAFSVFLTPDAFRGQVAEALEDAFSNRVLPDGELGFFHPDNFSFGQPVYLSQVTDAALAVAGVRAVDFSEAAARPHRFWRYGEAPRGELDSGQIRIGGREIARLDNDPSAPVNGRIEFYLEGGR